MLVPAPDIVAAIEGLDLSTYPYRELMSELKKIGKAGLVMHTFHPGYELIRVRINREGEHFSNVSELTYKPQNFNKTYQRGSTPNKTMFYGSSTQKDIPGADPIIGRKTALLEAMRELREPNTELQQVVTFSKWVVTKNIDLASICYDEKMHQNFPDHKFIYGEFIKFLDQIPQYKERTLLINSFLAEHFSSPEPEGKRDFLYMVSALYTEMVSEHHFEGVSYPSVRTIGFGINAAINPIAADEKLVCTVVGEAMVKKERYKLPTVDNLQTITLKPGQKDFKFR